ncbi:hypothetical protein AGMMS50239_03970 [Bacteroidia bacterium]|nr:hypothetical protein AGMMS50239_03970 [Bacteroidia bacterium]
MDSGEVIYNDKTAFGKVIELKGERIFTDSMMDPRVSGMLLKEDKLVFQYDSDPPFVLFQLQAMSFVAQKGKRGNGPDEFIFPRLVPTTDKNLICYILELTNRKLYTLDNHNQITCYPFKLSDSGVGSEMPLVNVGKDEFMYVESSFNGKSVFRTIKTNDSIYSKEIYNLNLKPDLDSWVPYIGDFAVNVSKNRMVYAYKYYKIISFMDLDANNVKTINFKQSEFDEATLHVADGLDLNVTHYFGVCGQSDYIYFIYSGRKPSETWKEETSNCYIEQYDWDGNPIRKFRLDHFGRFVVDEKNKRLYLSNPREDDPIYVYTLSD